MMRYQGEDKVAAALDDLLCYLQVLSQNNGVPNMESVTVKNAIKSLHTLPASDLTAFQKEVA